VGDTSLRSSTPRPPEITVSLSGIQAKALIDSGANACIIDKATSDKIKTQATGTWTTKACAQTIYSVSGEKISCTEKMVCALTLLGPYDLYKSNYKKATKWCFFVLDKAAKTVILGTDAIQFFGIALSLGKPGTTPNTQPQDTMASHAIVDTHTFKNTATTLSNTHTLCFDCNLYHHPLSKLSYCVPKDTRNEIMKTPYPPINNCTTGAAIDTVNNSPTYPVQCMALTKIKPPLRKIKHYRLKPSVFEKISKFFGVLPVLDGMATKTNAQCTQYTSEFPEHTALATDIFSMSKEKLVSYTNNKFLWLNPLWNLLSEVTQWIKQVKHNTVLLAPLWTNRQWYVDLCVMAKKFLVIKRQHGLFLDPWNKPMPTTSYDFICLLITPNSIAQSHIHSAPVDQVHISTLVQKNTHTVNTKAVQTELDTCGLTKQQSQHWNDTCKVHTQCTTHIQTYDDCAHICFTFLPPTHDTSVCTFEKGNADTVDKFKHSVPTVVKLVHQFKDIFEAMPFDPNKGSL